MASDIGGYLFVCSASTEAECYRRKLLATNTCGEVVLGVRPGATLFLYNYGRRYLRGPLIATSSGDRDIVPGAWNGSFPFQVRFEFPPDGIREIGKNLIESFIPFASAGMPYIAISIKAKDQLITLLESSGSQVDSSKLK